MIRGLNAPNLPQKCLHVRSVVKMFRTYHITGRPAGSEVKMLQIYHRTDRPAGSEVKMLRTYHRTG